ncbi:Glycosyltransferase involved in cell wall bisynthesis [Methanophagales archaeon]|nr:Glycosyltransferase involved in cell wall bisynthesis [Methanophagales archaeon]
MGIMCANKKLNGLKIIYIGQASLNDSGVGGAARVEGIVSIFKRVGVEIKLISYSIFSNKFGIEHKEIEQSLQTTVVYVPTNLPKFLKMFAIIPIFVYAWKFCKNCDLMFADFTYVVTSVPVVILKKIFNKPIILDYIDLGLEIIPAIAKKYMIKNTDAIFAISPYLLELAIKKYGCKNAVYVPIFVDPSHFKVNLTSREKVRKELEIKKDEIVIGYAGSFRYVEGVPFLIHAFKNLTKKYPKIKLAIMGKIYVSTSDDNIQKLVEDTGLKHDVILIHSQPHEEVPKFLSAFDVLCCPKIDCEINRAANPVKVVEYLSMGLPTVCSAVGGITDTIEDGVDGLLVKPGDVNDLEDKLEWIILNPKRSKEMGENGRKTAIEKYSYEAIEDTIRQAISEIVDKKKGKTRR